MRRILSVWLCALVIIGSMTIFSDIDHEAIAEAPVKSPMYTSRGPIEILSDADFTVGNGVTGGTGIAGDPYIVEGWWINNTGPDYAVSIQDTDAYATIRNCKITNISYYDWGIPGLNLIRANNFTIQNCTFSEIDTDWWGFRIGLSNNVTVKDNLFIDTSEVLIDWSADILVYNNTFNYSNPEKLRQERCERVNYWNNTFINSGIELAGWGTEFFENTEIYLNNTVNSKPLRYYKGDVTLDIDSSINAGQIIVFQSGNVNIHDFNMSNTAVGIEVAWSNYVVCRDSMFLNNSEGFISYDNVEVLIENITCNNNTGNGGVLFSRVPLGHDVNNSTFEHNGYAGLLAEAEDARIYNNTFSDNEIGLYIENPGWDTYVNNCQMTNNEFGVKINEDTATIMNCQIMNNTNGIHLWSRGPANFQSLELNNNTDYGILCNSWASIDSVNILDSRISNSSCGISFTDVSLSNITGCDLINNNIGIQLTESSNGNSITDSQIHNNGMGIELHDSTAITASNNNITNCVGFTHINDFNSFIGEEVYQNDGNTGNYSSFEEQLATGQLGAEPLYTKPILLQDAMKFDVIVVGQADSPDLDLGVFLDGKGGNPIDGITQTGEIVDYSGNWDANEDVSLEFPEDGTYLIRVFGYDVSANPGHFDMNITISSLNSSAIYSVDSSSTIIENMISDNYVGVQMDSGTGNIIYHNNFIGNSNHAIDLGNNTWDNGVLSGGNHWDNWTAPDNNVDGYVDSPLVIGNDNQDNWPFAQLWFDDITAPIADAGINSSIDQGDIVLFNASGSSDNVGIVNYSWDFNYNGTAVQLFGIAPTYEYLYTDNCSVNLTVRDAGGNSGTDQVWVDVRDNPNDPTADAGLDVIIDQHEEVIFNASSSSSMFTIENYTWEFIYDEGAVTLYGEVTDFIFRIVGNYSVNLTISAGGDTGTDQMWIHVRDITSPTAVAGDQITIEQGTILSFNGSASTDNVGIVNYTWNVSYGGQAQAFLYEVTPYFEFTEPGFYFVRLNVSDAAGNFDIDGFAVYVVDTDAPLADAGVDQEVEVGALVTFSGTGSTDNVGIANYTWTFTYNGSAVTLYGVSPEFQFWVMGNYTVTLNVTDAEGNWDVDQLIVSITEGSTPGHGGNYWWILVILIVLVGIVLFAFLIRNQTRKNDVSEITDEK